MWVTDETGERKKKCVGVQKIYRFALRSNKKIYQRASLSTMLQLRLSGQEKIPSELPREYWSRRLSLFTDFYFPQPVLNTETTSKHTSSVLIWLAGRRSEKDRTLLKQSPPSFSQG